MKTLKALLSLMILFSTVLVSAQEEMNRHNITDEQSNARRLKTDNLVYVKLGYGTFFGQYKTSGSSFGFGVRHEIDHMAVDASFLNFIIGQNAKKGFSGNIVQLQGLYFFSPLSNSSLYSGGGVAYNTMRAYSEKDKEEPYKTGGIAGVATIGFETMRVSMLRLFFQADATMPFQRMKNGSKSYYGSTLSLSMGCGF